MSRPAPWALYLLISLIAGVVLAFSVIPARHPVTENVTDAIPAAGGGHPPPSLASPTASGAAGGTFTAHSTRGTAYRIRLRKVTQQATLTPYESPVTGGDHIAAAEFTIAGKTGLASDDPDLAAVAAGSNGDAYLAADDDITGGPSFQGQFTITRGQSRTGWVTFELPPDVAVTGIQWRPAFGTGAITWIIPAEKGPSPDGVDRGH